MYNLELAVDKGATKAEYHRLERAAHKASLRLGFLMGHILNDINIRKTDQREEENLIRSRMGESINTFRYFQLQYQDRQALEVPETLKIITITNKPLVSIRKSSLVTRRNMFGESIKEYGEAIVSSSKYSRELVGFGSRRKIETGVAHSAIHESGHLFGVVPRGASRETPGQHCNNKCIMRPGTSSDQVIVLDKSLAYSGFCSECLRDMR
jgi:predicted Zn-dependent protease